MEQILNEYYRDDAKKLHDVVNKIFYAKYGGISDKDMTEFYSAANDAFADIVRNNRDDESKGDFGGFLYGVLDFAIIDEFKKQNRDKRTAKIEVNIDGKLKKVPVADVRLDAPIANDGSSDTTYGEMIESDFKIEKESELGFDSDENVELFLNSLSKLKRKIIELKMSDYTSEEIKHKLKISDREYTNAIKSIQMNENLSLFSKNVNDCGYKEKTSMERVMEVNEAENYRMDKYSMFSLLEDKKSGDINCKYILQRKPFQWTLEERNRYICRILSNLPIPEIILCEQSIKGMMISHLIDGLQRLSYAEAFKENRFKIGANGAERHLIEYRDFILDENGNRVLDDDGIPTFEMKVCDVIGKTYKDLPSELKKRFNNFNINVTKFFNCTDEQIADHIRDYNNHAGMNNEQLGMTKISVDTARKIKEIADKNTFFKNCGKYSDANAVKGKIDKIVTESIMLIYHRNEWKAKIDKAYQYVDENVSDEEFYGLNSDLNRLELILGEDNKEFKETFTVSNTPMWLAVFHEFTTYNIEDSRFVDFLRAYNNELNQKEIDGVSMSDFKDQQSKKKTTITGKIELLVKLMKEYLHIEENEESEDLEEVSVLDFVKENVNSNANEDDIEDYSSMLDVYVRIDEPIYKDENLPSLVAMVAYSYQLQKDIELEGWFKEFVKENKTFRKCQKDNYLHMKQSFDKYLEECEVA